MIDVPKGHEIHVFAPSGAQVTGNGGFDPDIPRELFFLPEQCGSGNRHLIAGSCDRIRTAGQPRDTPA